MRGQFCEESFRKNIGSKEGGGVVATGDWLLENTEVGGRSPWQTWQRIGIHDRSQCRPLCREKSDPMNDSAAFVSSLTPTLCLQIHYHKEERSLLYIVIEAAEEKAHGASGVDLSSSGARSFNAVETFTRLFFRQGKGLRWLLPCFPILCSSVRG